MRDQLNGQLYDGWRTDCDIKEFLGGFGARRVDCDSDDYTHNIIPADEDAAFRNYEDKLTEQL